MVKLNSHLFKLLIFAVGILSLVVAFLPALAYANSDIVYNGFELSLGTTFIDLGIFGSGEIAPNILVSLAYLFPISAGLLGIFLKRGAIISIFLFLVSAVLLFLVPELTITKINNTSIDVDWTMAYGLYISIGLSIFGIFLSIFVLSSDSYRKN